MAEVPGWLVDHVDELAAAITLSEPREVQHTIAAELMPLADAIRFLQRQAPRLLSTQTLSDRDRPFWVGNLKVRIAREPLGVVLVIGTWNYPLFLAGAQISAGSRRWERRFVQACAGNRKGERNALPSFLELGHFQKLIAIATHRCRASPGSDEVGRAIAWWLPALLRRGEPSFRNSLTP
jgi:hypothetical protein